MTAKLAVWRCASGDGLGLLVGVLLRCQWVSDGIEGADDGGWSAQVLPNGRDGRTLAEGVGFEPTETRNASPVFKTGCDMGSHLHERWRAAPP